LQNNFAGRLLGFDRLLLIKMYYIILMVITMNIELNFVKKGSGYPLILLHGNGEDYHYFDRQIDEFATHYTVYAVETRGHGKSPRGSKPFTISQFSDDLRDFMDRQQIERANILGFSDGGNIAMVFAIRYPERVNKLVLNGANATTNGLKAYFQIPTEIRYRLTLCLEPFSKKAKKEREMLELMVKNPVDSLDELANITAPTLVVAGTRDLIKSSHSRKIAESIPDSKLVFINGNHAVARLNPTVYNKTVLEFLED